MKHVSEKPCRNVDKALDPQTILGTCSKTSLDMLQDQDPDTKLRYVFEKPCRNVAESLDPKKILGTCSKTDVDMLQNPNPDPKIYIPF